LFSIIIYESVIEVVPWVNRHWSPWCRLSTKEMVTVSSISHCTEVSYLQTSLFVHRMQLFHCYSSRENFKRK